MPWVWSSAVATDHSKRVHRERAQLTGELERAAAALLLLDARDGVLTRVVQRDLAAAPDGQPAWSGEVGVGGVVLPAG